MQKVYNAKKSKYVWNFSKLDITYFEIPKTGSSSTKTVLFRLNYQLAKDSELHIGGGQLAKRFPGSIVQNISANQILGKALVIYRNPIDRVKSAYRSIFLGRQKMQGALSEYFDRYHFEYLDSDPNDGLLNHYKPMRWFFPSELLKDHRAVFVKTSDLDTLPILLGLDMSPITSGISTIPHLLNVNKKIGAIDMTDDEIRVALGREFEDDFAMYEKYSSSVT